MKLDFLSNLVKLVGLDLGSNRTRIWSNRHGFVVDEPSVIAVEGPSQKVLAVGQEAAEMEGRVNADIVIHHPIQHGQIYDLDIARAMLKVFLQRVFGTPYFFRPIMMASLPAASTESAKQSMIELLYAVGAKEAYTMSQPLAAAIGSGVPIADASGSFVVQMGSGLVETAVISLGSVIAHETSEQAGETIDLQIQQTLKNELGLLVSMSEAEKVKQAIGSVLDTDLDYLVSGQDVVESAPKEMRVTASMLKSSLMSSAQAYEQLLKKLLSRIPPALTVDVIDKGMLLSGGFSQLRGLDQYFINTLGVPVSVVEAPQQTVIKGVATALEHLDLFTESLGYR